MASKNNRKSQSNKSPENAEGAENEEEEEPEGAEAAGTGDGQEGDDDDEFERLAAGAQSASAATDAPWWERSEGAAFYGRITGMYYMQGNVRGPREYLQVVSLMDQTVCLKGKKKERKQVIVKKGQVISIGYNKALDVFFTKYAPQAEAGAIIHIGAKVTGEKIQTGSGNDFWPMKTVVKILKGAQSAWQPYRIGSQVPTPNAAEGGPTAGGEDIPF